MLLSYKYIYLELTRRPGGISNMRKGSQRLAKAVKTAAKTEYGELKKLFGPWVPLPQGFGSPKRQRLFSPLTHLLALSRSGLRRRWLLPRGVAQLSGVARC